MTEFKQWLADTPLGGAVKTAVAYLLGAAVAQFATDGAISFSMWQTWLIGALVAATPPVINWLNDEDPRYGRGSF